jgi:hypothetical protein
MVAEGLWCRYQKRGINVNKQDPNSPRPRKGLVFVAFVVAAVALIVAAIGAFSSLRAADRADEAIAKIDALAAQRQQDPAPPEPLPSAGDSAAPSPEASTASPEGEGGNVPSLTPQTQYKQRYADEALTVASKCNSDVLIDLDEPRVQVNDVVSEITFGIGCNSSSPPQITLRSGVEGSEVTSDSVQPVECAEKIRKSPLADNTAIPIRRGQVYCVKTSLDTARSSATSWKMVVLSVTAIAQDGTVSLKSSAWEIPS